MSMDNLKENEYLCRQINRNLSFRLLNNNCANYNLKECCMT